MIRAGIFTLGVAALVAIGCEEAPSSPKPAAASTTTASAPAASTSPSAAPEGKDFKAQATKLAHGTIIVDGHVDLPYRLHESLDKAGKLTENPAERTKKGDFDFPRARAGGLDAPFMSIYIPAEYQKKGGAKALADQLIDMVEGLIEKSPDKFAPAHSVADVEQNFANKKVSLPMGIENGAALEGKLENVAHFHKRGVRYITLTHSKDNDICDSSYDKSHTHKGLSELGRKVVAEMNRVGIMVDVSHISDDAFNQVMDISKAPVIASHSSCRHFTPGFERNMNDEMIKRLAAKDGVMMINFGSGFLDKDIQAAHDKFWEARKAFIDGQGLEKKDPKVEEFVDRYKKEHDMPFATVQIVADHIEHVIELAGIDHVGLGSDFDGVGDSLPTELKDVSQYPNLLAELLKRGHSAEEIAKICSGNVLRVWRAVEGYASQQKSAP